MNNLYRNKTVIVTGAGGFIGGALVSTLRTLACKAIIAVDIKPLNQWYQVFSDAQNIIADLKQYSACKDLLENSHADYVFNLAADMGGMGFIETHKALCMLSVLINTHLLLASKEANIKRYFFSSSACVYAAEKQVTPEVIALKEEDAYPAMPEDGYGWEKLFSERMCRHFSEDFRIETRIARYHNVYGPYGTYVGGREKAPAALCRKVIQAILDNNSEIEIWGDGEQTRSFMYIDDCIEGTLKIMESDIIEPINLGSNELVTINQLLDIIEKIAGIKLKRRYKTDAPQGVRGRNSDNNMIKHLLTWEPSISLQDGLEKTYRWIYDQMNAHKVGQGKVLQGVL